MGCALLFLHKKEKILKRYVHKETAEVMPHYGYLGSLYYFAVVRRRKGLAMATVDSRRELGGTYASYFLRPIVTISDVEDVKYVLKNIDDFPKEKLPEQVLTVIRPVFGTESVGSINNPSWHDHRSIMNKAFTNNKMFFDPLQAKSKQCIDLWKTDQPVLIGSDIQKMTLDALGSCIFGKDFDSLGGKLAGPLSAYNTIMKYLLRPYILLFPWTIQLPIPPFNNLRKCIREFDEACWHFIEETKQQLAKQIDSSNLISLMVMNGLPDQAIRDNVGVFFLAGHETTASTLSWACVMLATHQDIQTKLRNEIALKTDNFSRDITYDDLKDFTYLEYFIKETMRLYPAAPIIGGRYTLKDCLVGNWFLPKDTSLQFNLISMLQDPHTWDQPLLFDPDRWSPDRLTKEQRSCWLPFSYGPRICIGMNFSLLEQKIFLCNLLKFRKIELTQGSIVRIDPSNPIHIPDMKHIAFQFSSY
uniref:Cytochrome P450 n=1 Tax=Arcella intermedia TaxID=1963864 RepID=A0A6B2L331_9EUKA